MGKDVMQWLREVRKLDAGLLEAMGVKADPQGDAVAFPYRRGGKAYAWKFRTEEKRFWSTQGVTRGLYNEDDLRRLPDLPIVITEGEMDCLSVMQAGFERAVSVPDGWKEDGKETEALIDAEPLLRQSPYVIVAGDNDKAGESLPRVVANLLKGHDVRQVFWPDGCKDANDVLMKHGESQLVICLNSARRIDPKAGLITGFSDLPPLGERRVLRIGEKPFDWAVALEVGALSVWTGTPGSGKSTFLTWAAERISVNEGIRVGLMAFETHPHTIRDQLSLIRCSKDFASLDEASAKRLTDDLDKRFRLVHHIPTEGDDRQHLTWLESMVWTLAVRDRCKLIIIDPWNELEHLPEPGETMTSYINFATKMIRQWAEKLEVHIALVAHPKKMTTEGKPRPPTGYDVADSAAFFNKPSLGVTVHQVKYEDKETGQSHEWVELNVWKVRNTRLYGIEKGTIKCDFHPRTMRYTKHD